MIRENFMYKLLWVSVAFLLCVVVMSHAQTLTVTLPLSSDEQARLTVIAEERRMTVEDLARAVLRREVTFILQQRSKQQRTDLLQQIRDASPAVQQQIRDVLSAQ
jgi:hypothetical protein